MRHKKAEIESRKNVNWANLWGSSFESEGHLKPLLGDLEYDEIASVREKKPEPKKSEKVENDDAPKAMKPTQKILKAVQRAVEGHMAKMNHAGNKDLDQWSDNVQLCAFQSFVLGKLLSLKIAESQSMPAL
jgi:hypothetical protein